MCKINAVIATATTNAIACAKHSTEEILLHLIAGVENAEEAPRRIFVAQVIEVLLVFFAAQPRHTHHICRTVRENGSVCNWQRYRYRG
jgi:hypothetical protein